jgi:two-component system sensor histidine kinase YesM
MKLRQLSDHITKLTLFTKMFLFMTIAVFIPVASLGYLSFHQSREQLDSISSQFLQDNVKLNGAQINNFFSSVEKESEKIVSSLDLQKLLRSEPPKNHEEETVFISRMIELIRFLKGSYGLYVFPNRLENYPNYRKLINQNQIEPKPEYFKRAFETHGKGIWYHVWDDNLQKPIFIYVRAVRTSYYYEALGVVVIQVPDSMMREQLTFPSSFNNYSLMLVDDNQVISSPSAKLYEKSHLLDPSLTKAETKLSVDGWNLIAAVPKEEFTGNINQIKSFTYWIVTGSLLLIGFFLFVIVRSFTIPVNQLVRHMNKIRTGLLYPFRSYTRRQDEIGQLVQGYNEMIVGMTDLLETTKQMESDKRQLEIQTLNHQINPHFFYNTLDAIKWKAESANETVIASMVTKLSNLLRFSLNNGDEWTTVEREVMHARNYLDIELLRSNRSFQVFYQVDPDIQKLKIIKLILQPIMENAVKHGMNHLFDGKGKIRLTAKRSGMDILFIIEDNGPGMAEERAEEARSAEQREYSDGHGLGLKNVHTRLQLHFGGDYGVQMDPNRQSGFRVLIRHPIFNEDRAESKKE